MRRIDSYLPTFHFSEKHAIQVNALPEQAMIAACGDEFRSADVFRLFLKLRTTLAKPIKGGVLNDHEFVRSGGVFYTLNSQPEQGLIFGAIGKLWSPTSEIRRIDTPEYFANFDDPGFFKVAVDFRARAVNPGQTILSTETRVYCTNRVAWWYFLFYWILIRSGSGWVRTMWLKRAKREAEQMAY